MALTSIFIFFIYILFFKFIFFKYNDPSYMEYKILGHFPSGGQSIGVSALAWIHPRNTQDWSPLEWTGWISYNEELSSEKFNWMSILISQLSFVWKLKETERLSFLPTIRNILSLLEFSFNCRKNIILLNTKVNLGDEP